METYGQLTYEDRIVIAMLRQANCSIRYITGFLKRSPSTISREIMRNSGERGYRYKQAHENAITRRHKPRRIKMTPEVVEHIESQIRNDHANDERNIINRSYSTMKIRRFSKLKP